MSKSSVILPQRWQNGFPPPNRKAGALSLQQSHILGPCWQKTFCKLATSFFYQVDHSKHPCCFQSSTEGAQILISLYNPWIVSSRNDTR